MYQAVSLHATQMIHSSYLLWVHVKLLFSTLDSLVLHNIFTRGEFKKKWQYCDKNEILYILCSTKCFETVYDNRMLIRLNHDASV